MNGLRRTAVWVARTLRWAAWWTLGAWTVLAVFFKAPFPAWLATLSAAAIGVLWWTAQRERRSDAAQPALPWSQRPRTLAAFAIAPVVAVYYFGFITPDPNQNWVPEHSRMPHVEIDGEVVHVDHVRNFTWRTPTDFTPAFYRRTYDLNAIDSMYYVVAPMPIWHGVAHVFVCFGFSDGQFVAVSVEGRRVVGRPYRLIPSMFRQYQLIYVIGDERDVVGLRGAVWKKPVFFYPVRTTTERKRAILVDMMERAHSLEEHPEFYHLIVNNCMNNITHHLRRLGGRDVPRDMALLLTGFSDQVAFRYGFIDTDLTFEQARRAFRVDGWMQQTELDEGFSKRLREVIAEQVAAETNRDRPTGRRSVTSSETSRSE